jgi:hypothetical protein
MHLQILKRSIILNGEGVLLHLSITHGGHLLRVDACIPPGILPLMGSLWISACPLDLYYIYPQDVVIRIH